MSWRDRGEGWRIRGTSSFGLVTTVVEREREKGMGKREGKIAVRNSLGRELEERAEVR